ncbi:MAG TPA: hypothetical protein PJ988_22325 [Anaerolinea sp.]|nr:hypothetical protein [Anaerolinea sp.]
MNHRIAAALLLGFSGLVAVLGLAGAQIANAIVLSGFYAGPKTGAIPPSPEAAGLPLLVIVVSLVQALLGVYLFLKPEKHP